MRRLSRIFLVLFIILIAAILTSPWWIGSALRPILRANGVTLASSETNGYSRLVLNGISVATPSTDVTVGRVELDTPWVLLWRRAFSSPGPVTIDNCAITLKAAPASENQPAETAPSGILPTRDLIANLRAQIAPWLPSLSLTRIRINLAPDGGSAPIAIGSLTVSGDKTAGEITISGIVYDTSAAAAKIAFAPDAITLTAGADTPQTHLDTTLAFSADTLRATFRALDQEAALTARFAPDGWLPAEAFFDAPALALTAQQLGQFKLSGYTAATGSARVEYRDARLTANITARAEASATDTQLPALNIALHAQGSLDRIDVTTLDIALPFLTAKLSAPVTITRDLRLLTSESRFTLDADLSKQPWLPDTAGRITGEVIFATARLEKLDATARLDAENIRIRDITISRANLAISQQGHLTTLAQLDIALPAGSHLSATGQYDTATRSLSETTLDARIRFGDFAPWLPATLRFEDAALSIAASGLVAKPDHKGTLSIKQFLAPGLANPADMTAGWHGRALAADTLNLALAAAGTELRLTAADLTHDRATLTALTLRKDKTDRLALVAPATYSRAPDGAIALTPLALASHDGVSKLSLQAAFAPPAPDPLFAFSFSAANIDSALFADLADTGPLPWSIASAELTAALAASDAPLTASLALAARLDYAQTLPAAAQGMSEIPDSAFINAAAALTPKGISISHLAINETNSRSLIAHVSGEIPVTIRPVSGTPILIDKNAPLALDAHTQPDSPFWQNLARATGITLESPRINARLEGTLQKPAANASIVIARLGFDKARWPKRFPKLPDLPPIPPVSDLDASITTDGSTLDLAQFSLRVAGQPMTASARFTLDKNLGPEIEALSFSSDADLAAFAPYAGSIVAPRGRLRLDVALGPGRPLEGRLQVNDAALRPVAPLGVVSSINADARLSGSLLEITSATALIGNQPATVAGTIALPEPGEKKSAFRPDLSIKASNIPFVREPGLLVRGDIDLRINTADTNAGRVPRIQGAINLRESLFLADLRSLWSTRPASGPASRPPFFAIETPPLDKWLLDIDVRGSRFLRIDTTIFAGQLSAAFKLDGTLGDPRLTGDASTDSGKLRLPFASFTTQTGRVRLTKASPHTPSIEFSATSRTLGYDLRMDINGTLDNPRLAFTSSPALTSEQILLFVMAGETPGSDLDYSSQQRALSFGAYLGQGIFNEIFGVSSDEERLTLSSGEKLTRQGRETYNVEYKLADRWTAVGEYDEFDAYNLGLKWLAYRSKQRDSSTPPKKEKSANAPKATPPTLKIAGRGFWTNLTSKRMLQRTLSLDASHPPALSANEVEDAAFLLVSQLVSGGYMHPKLELTATPAAENAAAQTFSTNETLDTEFPRELSAKQLRIKITPGLRYKLRDVTFTRTGPASLTDDDAREFFLPNKSLFGGKSIPYSPAALKNAVSALQETLKQKGRAKAAVTMTGIDIDDATGRVTARIDINEGPLWKIQTLETALAAGSPANDASLSTLDAALRREFTGIPWSQWTQQDIAEKVRQHYYRHGYPDIAVQVTQTTATPDAAPPSAAPQNETPVAVRVAITPGPQVRIGDVRVKGSRHTRPSLIKRRLHVQSGDLLNPLALESARHRISRLGVFRSIDVDYDPVGGDVRNVSFNLAEYPQTSLSLLLGWGSYEQLRGGVEIRRLNTLGIADQTRLQLIQSMKSTSGDLTFSLPDLFARGVNGSVRAFGLRRDEAAFVREEYGGTVTLRRAWPSRGYEVSAGYTHESLNSSNDILSPDAGETSRTIAATINLSIGRDRRDNPLSPKKGYNWYLQGEFASRYFGGEANYQRYRAGVNYHTPWGRTRWIHAGLSQGFIIPIGRRDTPLPVNKLFYPGGENSIRGYQDGEAAPRDAGGAFLGAKTYTLLNLEIEQALVGSLSLVVFHDLLGASAKLSDYPGGEWLASAGIGLRYHTILGPLRLEYGRNLNPRAGDPGGTLHFSVGIPF